MKIFGLNAWIWLLIIIGLVVFLTRDTKNSPSTRAEPKDVNKMYHSKWKQPGADPKVTTEISRTLASENISGCGEYYYKESISTDNEYLVACFTYEEVWKFYLVWPGINDVLRVQDQEFRKPNRNE